MLYITDCNFKYSELETCKTVANSAGEIVIAAQPVSHSLSLPPALSELSCSRKPKTAARPKLGSNRPVTAPCLPLNRCHPLPNTAPLLQFRAMQRTVVLPQIATVGKCWTMFWSKTYFSLGNPHFLSTLFLACEIFCYRSRVTARAAESCTIGQRR